MYIVKAGKDFDVQASIGKSEFFCDTEISAYVPKFKLEYSISFDEALHALGVNTAYDQQKAGISAMVDKSEPVRTLTLPGLFLSAHTTKLFTFLRTRDILS